MNKSILFLFSLLLLFISSCTKNLPTVGNKDKVFEVAHAIDDEKIFPWVEQLTAIHLSDIPISNEGYPPKDLFPSDHLTRSAAVGFIADAFSEMGYTADTVILGDQPPIAYNVVAEHKGAIYPNEVVLVAGHLDAFYGGADDNTSAIAAMLEIARVVHNRFFARTIRFVAFDLEELGSVGSTRYIEAGYANDVTSAVVMDLIGYFSNQPGSQKDIKGVKVPDNGDYLFAIGNENSAEYTQKVVINSAIKYT